MSQHIIIPGETLYLLCFDWSYLTADPMSQCKQVCLCLPLDPLWWSRPPHCLPHTSYPLTPANTQRGSWLTPACVSVPLCVKSVSVCDWAMRWWEGAVLEAAHSVTKQTLETCLVVEITVDCVGIPLWTDGWQACWAFPVSTNSCLHTSQAPPLPPSSPPSSI